VLPSDSWQLGRGKLLWILAGNFPQPKYAATPLPLYPRPSCLTPKATWRGKATFPLPQRGGVREGSNFPLTPPLPLPYPEGEG